MVREWCEDKEASTLYSEDVGSERRVLWRWRRLMGVGRLGDVV